MNPYLDIEVSPGKAIVKRYAMDCDQPKIEKTVWRFSPFEGKRLGNLFGTWTFVSGKNVLANLTKVNKQGLNQLFDLQLRDNVVLIENESKFRQRTDRL